MTAYEITLLFIVACAELATLVVLIHRNVDRRFPCLILHLALEAVSQLAVSTAYLFAPEHLVQLWYITQGPRLIARVAVTAELSMQATVFMLRKERLYLFLTCAGACATLIWIAWSFLPSQWALLSRQYGLFALGIWLAVISLYLLIRPSDLDWNLKLYLGFATFSFGAAFLSGSFVRGGIGYTLLPFDAGTWRYITEWRCWSAILLLSLLCACARRESGQQVAEAS